MLTELEAKTKWCPFVRFKSNDSGSGPAYNRSPSIYGSENLLCIGSRCMAWRESEPADKMEYGLQHDAVAGYCGAFGASE
jgi:hypothetical protein